jgi:hypothetical protein
MSLTPVNIQHDYDAEKGSILLLRVFIASDPRQVIIKNFLETFKGEPEKDLSVGIADINIAADDAPEDSTMSVKYKRQLVRALVLCLTRN